MEGVEPSTAFFPLSLEPIGLGWEKKSRVGSKRKAAHRHPLYVHQDPSTSLAILLRFSSRYLG